MGRNLADVEYKMRMTQELKEKIVESAKEHNRSMNADIVARLEQSFAVDKLSYKKVSELTGMFTEVWDENKKLRKENDLLKENIREVIKQTVVETINEFKKTK